MWFNVVKVNFQNFLIFDFSITSQLAITPP